MNTINRILMPLLLSPAAAPQGDGRFALSCDALLTPDSKEETLRLGNAPHHAKRVEKHRLEVSWVGGRQAFVNKPPYDEPFACTTRAYCGSDAQLNLHLLLKRDERLLTGVLLDDRIGGILPGGQTVMFSPDRGYSLARSGKVTTAFFRGIRNQLLPTLRGCTGTATIGYTFG